MHSVLFVAALTVVLSGDLNRMNSDQCLLWQFSELLRPTHNNVEVAAFVVRDDAGTLSCLLWPRLSWGRSQRFRGTIPQRTVAIVHTHHFSNDERPSPDDANESIRVGLPFYVVSHHAVWLFDPASKQAVQIAGGHNWWPTREPSGSCAKPRPLGRD